MELDDCHEDHDDSPAYRTFEEVGQSELSDALRTLRLLGDDPFLRMQALNLSVVDQFIMRLEHDALRKLHNEEATPGLDAMLLSAQSQMWIFAAYEFSGTWRVRAKDALKLFENGGLKLKIDDLEKDLGYLHVGRGARADQLRRILSDHTVINLLREDIRLTHIVFTRMEHIRISIAKHEVKGNSKKIADLPGYGRINKWCGSLDYELENSGMLMGCISRRDIADELRAVVNRGSAPSDDDIASFDAFMKGAPPDPFS